MATQKKRLRKRKARAKKRKERARKDNTSKKIIKKSKSQLISKTGQKNNAKHSGKKYDGSIVIQKIQPMSTTHTTRHASHLHRSIENNRKKIVLVVSLSMLLASVLYVQTIWSPFIYDDDVCVVKNKAIQSPENIIKLWHSSYFAGSPNLPAIPLYRPLTSTTYLVDYMVYGLRPYGFHITNIILHALATGLIVIMIYFLGGTTATSLIAGLLFASHPVHTESVSWIVGRAELLACIACFSCIIFWTRYRKEGTRIDLVFCLIFYFLGMASKEIAAPLPAVLLAGDLLGLFSSKDSVRRYHLFSGQSIKSLAPYLLLLVVFILYACVRISVLGRFGGSTVEQILHTAPSYVRWFTAISSIGKYAQLLILPVELRIDYGDFKIFSFLDWRFLLGSCVTIGLILLVIKKYRRRPAYCFWASWFLIFVFPVTNIIFQLGVTLAERFLYIPSASICALVGILTAKLFEKYRFPSTRKLLFSVLVLMLVACSYKTIERNRDWQDTERFWRKAVEQSPNSAKMLYNLSHYILKNKNSWESPEVLDEAEQLLRSAVRSYTDSGKEHIYSLDRLILNHQLAIFLRKRGRKHEALEQFQRLTRLCNRSLPLGLRQVCARGWNNIGTVYHEDGEMDAAIKAYQKAIEVNPGLDLAYSNYSLALLRLNRNEEALKVIQRYPGNENESQLIMLTKGYALESLGKCMQANDQYRRVLTKNPTNTDAREGLKRLKDCGSN